MIRGPIFCTPEGWYGAHFFLKISFPLQPEAKNRKFGLLKIGLIRSPKTGADTRAPCQPYFFWGSVSALQTLPTAERTIGTKLFENFRKTTRAPNQLFPFRRKNDISAGASERRTFKSLPKVWHNLHPAFRRKNDFSHYDAKKRSVPQKAGFRPDFQNLAEKAASQPRGQIARTLEKLAPNDPNWRFPPPDTRVAHLDLSMYPPFFLLLLSTFLCMGGGLACVCLSLATVYLLLFVWFVVFDLFSFICFALGK